MRMGQRVVRITAPGRLSTVWTMSSAWKASCAKRRSQLEHVGTPHIGRLENREPVLRGFALEVLHKDRLDLVALVEECRGIDVGGECGTVEQFPEAHDGAHGKREVAIGRCVYAIRCAKVGVCVVDGTALGWLCPRR